LLIVYGLLLGLRPFGVQLDDLAIICRRTADDHLDVVCYAVVFIGQPSLRSSLDLKSVGLRAVGPPEIRQQVLALFFVFLYWVLSQRCLLFLPCIIRPFTYFFQIRNIVSSGAAARSAIVDLI
jgi:hypothetical protein